MTRKKLQQRKGGQKNQPEKEDTWDDKDAETILLSVDSKGKMIVWPGEEAEPTEKTSPAQQLDDNNDEKGTEDESPELIVPPTLVITEQEQQAPEQQVPEQQAPEQQAPEEEKKEEEKKGFFASFFSWKAN